MKKRLPLTQVAAAIAPYGFVYVFGALDLVKVGITLHSVYRRWWCIKVANPWLEPPLYVSPPLYGEVRAMEKACHRALRPQWFNGEWFKCDRQFAIEIVRSIVHEQARTPLQVDSRGAARAQEIPGSGRVDRALGIDVAHLRGDREQHSRGPTRQVWTRATAPGEEAFCSPTFVQIE